MGVTNNRLCEPTGTKCETTSGMNLGRFRIGGHIFRRLSSVVQSHPEAKMISAFKYVLNLFSEKKNGTRIKNKETTKQQGLYDEYKSKNRFLIDKYVCSRHNIYRPFFDEQNTTKEDIRAKLVQIPVFRLEQPGVPRSTSGMLAIVNCHSQVGTSSSSPPGKLRRPETRRTSSQSNNSVDIPRNTGTTTDEA